ncbi:putative Ig domain-containing protein [Larkinella punicea]|uniref:T9SS C-terminal target domain-containing protein n=1 Tax=Larkinella punicea TaxID=2315727 RepID=A0A368JGI4_9BACT|nr:putative Ig domain-containing protein [Larkinella punicea]RCR65653.1 T9SS C-terminal target domain-containing protein [Larkinella punicea]
MKSFLQIYFWLLVLLFGTQSAFSQPTVFYVTQNGAGSRDGSSWQHAYDGSKLQTAIDSASAYWQANQEKVVQVWVAQGIYKPTTGTDRFISFTMKDHVAIYGGFVGNENALSARPPITLSMPSSTTLSGDIGEPGIADNSFHVLFNASLTSTAVLDGFLITGGNSDGGGGGGIYNSDSSPIIRNCCFLNNKARNGGGLLNISKAKDSDPDFINCSFIANRAEWAGYSGSGGGVYNLSEDNSSGSPRFINCEISGNSVTEGMGGGMMNISGNNDGKLHPWLINCTFVNNSGDMRGKAIYNFKARGTLNLTVVNCLFWNNGGENSIYNDNITTVTAQYSLFDDTVTGLEGNTNLTTTTSPFVSDTDRQLRTCSPAINAGDPASTTATSGTTDLAGSPRFYNNGRIDIGALEFQGSPLPIPVLSLPPSITLPIIQNTPLVSLTITGCETGNLRWSGPNNTSGTGTSIAIPTSATATLVYSATCSIGSCVSDPGSVTVSIVPGLVSGSFDGYVNGADCGSFRGWAWDRNKANTPVSIDILDGPTVITMMLADVFRQDLQTAGKGNGKHAFSFPIPESLKDGLPHQLSARVAGSSFMLKDSPKNLICQSSTTPEGNKPPVAPTPTVLVAPLAAQVGVPFSATLVAFTDPESGSLTYGLSGLPAGLTINSASRVIGGTPTEAGSFVLAYSATDPAGATNSVSFVLTVTAAATTTVTGNFEGYLDKVECGTIRGWVWDRNQPNAPVTVEFYTGSTVWGSTVANLYRVDLKNAGKGNGFHAYSFAVPASLIGTGTHVLYGRVQGSSYVLKDSGKPLTCPSPVRLSAEDVRELTVTVLGNPVSEQVELEIRGAEGQALRVVLTNSLGHIVSEHRIEKASVVQKQSVGISTLPAGMWFLNVSTADQTRTLKVVKP